MENCVSNDPKDKIEFNFFGGGGTASGRYAITVFALLVIGAFLVVGFALSR